MIRTFQISITTIQELNTISDLINRKLDKLNADFVSITEPAFAKVNTTLNGALLIVAYKTRA